MDDVANGTMSVVSVEKTRRCSGFGENVADTLAKGELSGLDRLGVSNPYWARPSRILVDWVKKPVVTPNLGKLLLDEMSRFMEVIIPPSCLLTDELEQCDT